MRIAAFQRHPLFDDIPGTACRLRDDLARCDADAVDLALFPECYLQGYAADRETIARRALSRDGVELRTVLSALADIKTTFVLGMIERRAGSLFDSALVVRSGAVLGAYAKTCPYESGFDAGAEFPVFAAAGWTFGINICNEANFSGPATFVVSQGAGLICYPLNNMLRRKNAERWRMRGVQNLRTRARETGCWIASADIVGEHRDQISHGLTCVVDPEGRIPARAPEGEEAALIVDLR